MDNNFEKSLKIAKNKHDIIGLNINDEREKNLVSVGMIKVIDSETGIIRWIDTSNKKNRNIFNYNHKKQAENLKNIFKKKLSIDFININTGQDYIKPLMNFFKKEGTNNEKIFNYINITSKYLFLSKKRI